jgi:glutathione peroxidase-family protein
MPEARSSESNSESWSFNPLLVTSKGLKIKKWSSRVSPTKKKKKKIQNQGAQAWQNG